VASLMARRRGGCSYDYGGSDEEADGGGRAYGGTAGPGGSGPAVVRTRDEGAGGSAPAS
jgi:hypothetical protein